MVNAMSTCLDKSAISLFVCSLCWYQWRHKSPMGERSGSVVECLTRGRGVAGSGLTDVLEQDTLILA